MSAVQNPAESREPTRSEVAEYLHDVAGQLADMAESAGLAAAAAALRSAREAIEAEF